jgi:hypothetical protein
LFGERYGTETVVPSMRPIAAWLALRQPEFLKELIRRDPLSLIRNGDPRSLSLDAKKGVLLAYARMQADAQISDDSLDNRAIAQFSDVGLADTVRAAWKSNKNSEFRLDLLRTVREGRISACLPLARSACLDGSAGDYNRIVALQALKVCSDTAGLSAVAKWLTNSRNVKSGQLAANFAKLLYPDHLTTKQLLSLIEAHPSHKQGFDGFNYLINDLYNACPNEQSRSELVSGIAALCLKPPFKDEWRRISEAHGNLARNLGLIAASEVQRLHGAKVLSHVVQLLMVVERAEEQISLNDRPTLRELVASNEVLRQALFWADVEEVRRNGKGELSNPTAFWHVQTSDRTLWSFSAADVTWMYRDLGARTREEDKRILLSAIYHVLNKSDRLAEHTESLAEIVAKDPILQADLERYLAPPSEDEQSRDFRRRQEARDAETEKRREDDKRSWRVFHSELQMNPAQLVDKSALGTWKGGAIRLHNLTRWLERRVSTPNTNVALEWRLLTEGFGKEIAEAYRDGMRVLWRVTKPERPLREKDGPVTTKHTTVLAYNAIGLESAEDPDWTSKLSNKEAKLAIDHACMAEQGVPAWLEELIDSHPGLAIPAIHSAVRMEWKSKAPGQSDFLYYFAKPDYFLRPAIEGLLFTIVSGNEPTDKNKLDVGLRILSKLALGPPQILALSKLARRRIAHYGTRSEAHLALRYLALLLMICHDKALQDLDSWITQVEVKKRKERAEQAFASLFDRNDSIMPNALSTMSIAGLERLLRLAYDYIRPEHDEKRQGSYTPEMRDHAESARSSILSTIIQRPGPESFQALLEAANDPKYRPQRHRFLELARGMAERDSEFPAWTEREVIRFEQDHASPVKTGEDLLRVVIAVLKDIQFQMDKADANSRPLLQRAQNEDEVRNHIVEQMQGRSRDRFHAYREAQIANRDRPDIIVASTSAQCEVGIEVKHGGKSWTKAQLEGALKVQLSEDYLKPLTRRHGVFIMTKHTSRRWRDPETGKMLTFESLMKWLTKEASEIRTNSSGPISVRCVGLDSSPPPKESSAGRSHSTRSR